MCHQVMWLEFSIGKAGRQDRQTAENTVLCEKGSLEPEGSGEDGVLSGRAQVVGEDKIQARNEAEGEKVIAHDRSQRVL